MQEHFNPRTNCSLLALIGTLGVPEVNLLGFTLFSKQREQYSFINAEVPQNVEYACTYTNLIRQKRGNTY